ncbi:type III secretion system domain-containing protein [Burkholderia ubonensis]|uniref:type III secretion system domain-containing protein n=1 Tax=Burkholderia ubonensis TaxID=101571 RepID=UPI00075E6235|nr:type III secretion system domain-containing protein [Burkholderia ubonensis]KWN63604.1 hypothetical protein WM23_12650 [Burkholderia ubonensis]
MNEAALTPELSRLHQIGWQPGAVMHDDWWSYLGLERWRDSYVRYSSCRAAVDQLIVHRRGYPTAALPARLNEQQAAMMALEPRLNELAIAAGLIVLDCPDYLVMKPYRDRLSSHLGERGCSQLLTLHSGWDAGRCIAKPADLIETALHASSHWWHRDSVSCVVAALLASRLPPPETVDSAKPALPRDSMPTRLIKIARFL